MCGRIDVHSHFVPSFYHDALVETGHGRPDGMPAIPDWNVGGHLSMMSSLGISKSILSISSPGPSLYTNSPVRSAGLARRCNEYSADLNRRYPDKFGFFASVSLPFVNESLEEIVRTFADGADGVALMTNYQGYYLGDPLFDPVFELLDKMQAVVFIHPTTPCSHVSRPSAADSPTQIAAPLLDTYANPVFEFFFDTARVVTNILLRGIPSHFPNITFIVPHAAGAFPPLLSRIAGFSTFVAASSPGMGVIPTNESDAKALLATRFYFDLAGMPFPGQLKGMMSTMDIGPDRLLYGSDYPFTSADLVEKLAAVMDTGLTELFGKDGVQDVYFNNAARLLGQGPAHSVLERCSQT